MVFSFGIAKYQLLRASIVLLVMLSSVSISLAEKPKVVPNFGRGIFGVFVDAAVNKRVHDLLIQEHRSAPWVLQSDSVLFNVYIQVDPNSGLPIMPGSNNVQLLAVGIDRASASLQHIYQGDYAQSMPVHDKLKSIRVWVSVDASGKYSFQHMALSVAENHDVAMRKNYDAVIGSKQPKSGHIQVLRAMDPNIRTAPRLNPAGSNPAQTPPIATKVKLGPALGQPALDEITSILGEYANRAYQSLDRGVVAGGDDANLGRQNPDGAASVPVQTPHGTPTVAVDDGANGSVNWEGPVELEPEGPGGGGSLPHQDVTIQRR